MKSNLNCIRFLHHRHWLFVRATKCIFHSYLLLLFETFFSVVNIWGHTRKHNFGRTLCEWRVAAAINEHEEHEVCTCTQCCPVLVFLSQVDRLWNNILWQLSVHFRHPWRIKKTIFWRQVITLWLSKGKYYIYYILQVGLSNGNYFHSA
jgi:hypothetical protein